MMEASERISDSKATLGILESSVLFGFEVRLAGDPDDRANFKSRTLGRSEHLTVGFSTRGDCGSRLIFGGLAMGAASDRDLLSDEQWARIAPLIPGGAKGKRGPRANNRLFVEAIVWMARSGARWRDLPESFGKHDSVKHHYYDWVERGVFLSLFKALSEDADFDWLMLDSTIVRAHQHAAGARREKGGRMARGLAARAAACAPKSTPPPA